MKTFVLAAIGGLLCGGAFAGDLGGSGLRPSLAPSSLRPSISRPSMMQDLGVPGAPPPPTTFGGSSSSSAGGVWGSAGTSGGSWGGAGTSGGGWTGSGASGGGFAPGTAGEGAAPAFGYGDGSAARRAASGGAPDDPGWVVRKAMGIDDVPGAAATVNGLAPGVGAGDVVRKAMGIDDLNKPPGAPTPPADAATAQAADDSSTDAARPRARGVPAPVRPRYGPSQTTSLDWDTIRRALKGGITGMLEWAGVY